ncbi:hypothetical protein [Isobaculum melis]|uniref:Uncharacterized protein n=1 Tax=Isobaculum melis TaxID=142588 RepID=A0A1H9U5J1_9LACT|nr:hypothetical protein [Isobaculum melis]SES04840.1 hypothetical protein SAMN04488559_12211 [Isobaculum melis]
MKLYTKVKSIGKRRPILKMEEVEVKAPNTLKELISELVEQNVEKYNEKPIEEHLFYYLLEEDLQSAAKNGKIDFGERKNKKEQPIEQAIENALLSFKDGLYLVFIEEQEVKDLEAPLIIEEGNVLTFIKLTMLAGRMW